MTEALLFICIALCIITGYQFRLFSKERKLTDLLTQLYGTDMNQRLIKLTEEYFEVKNAWKKYQQDRTADNYEAFKAEICDLSGVITHILAITHQSNDVAIERVFDKINGRIKDPNYLREHKHEIMCCGNCARAKNCKIYNNINGSCIEWEEAL